MGKTIKLSRIHRKPNRVFKVNQRQLRDALAALNKSTVDSYYKRKCSVGNDSFELSAYFPLSLTYVALQLRKCFLRHNWVAASRLLTLLLNEGIRNMKRVIVKGCLLTAIHHPNSSPQLRKSIIRIFSGDTNTYK